MKKSLFHVLHHHSLHIGDFGSRADNYSWMSICSFFAFIYSWKLLIYQLHSKVLSLVIWSVGVDHLRNVFNDGMGLTDLDIVALSGAHTLVCSKLLVKLRCAIEMCLQIRVSIFNSWLNSHRAFSSGCTACTPVHMLWWDYALQMHVLGNAILGFISSLISDASVECKQGRCHKERSGFEGAWTPNPLQFDNTYFTWVMPFHFKDAWDEGFFVS
jgi:hypothetical protein